MFSFGECGGGGKPTAFCGNMFSPGSAFPTPAPGVFETKQVRLCPFLKSLGSRGKGKGMPTCRWLGGSKIINEAQASLILVEPVEVPILNIATHSQYLQIEG